MSFLLIFHSVLILRLKSERKKNAANNKSINKIFRILILKNYLCKSYTHISVKHFLTIVSK